MTKTVGKLVVLSLVILLLLAFTFLLDSDSGRDGEMPEGYEVVWSGNREPDAYSKTELIMQESEKRFYQIRDALIDNQITSEALLVLEEQWETQISLAKDVLIEDGISEDEISVWEEQQKERFLAWKEPLILVENDA